MLMMIMKNTIIILNSYAMHNDIVYLCFKTFVAILLFIQEIVLYVLQHSLFFLLTNLEFSIFGILFLLYPSFTSVSFSLVYRHTSLNYDQIKYYTPIRPSMLQTFLYCILIFLYMGVRYFSWKYFMMLEFEEIIIIFLFLINPFFILLLSKINYLEILIRKFRQDPYLFFAAWVYIWLNMQYIMVVDLLLISSIIESFQGFHCFNFILSRLIEIHTNSAITRNWRDYHKPRLGYPWVFYLMPSDLEGERSVSVEEICAADDFIDKNNSQRKSVEDLKSEKKVMLYDNFVNSIVETFNLYPRSFTGFKECFAMALDSNKWKAIPENNVKYHITSQRGQTFAHTFLFLGKIPHWELAASRAKENTLYLFTDVNGVGELYELWGKRDLNIKSPHVLVAAGDGYEPYDPLNSSGEGVYRLYIRGADGKPIPLNKFTEKRNMGQSNRLGGIQNIYFLVKVAGENRFRFLERDTILSQIRYVHVPNISRNSRRYI